MILFRRFNIFLMLFAFAVLQVKAQTAILPKPNSIQFKDGTFSYQKGFDIKIIRGDDATKKIQKQLTDFVKSKNIPVVQFATTAITINLLNAKDTDLSPESYTLSIAPNTISIASTGNAGLYYGIQSIMQLLRADTTKKLACVEIKDIPQFAYRGFHLDALHHYFDVEIIKQYIDAAAKLKLNQFQWQFADEKICRIMLKNHKTTSSAEQIYTTTQVQEIVKYAQERYVNIVPVFSFSADSANANLTSKKLFIDELSTLFPGTFVAVGFASLSDSVSAYLTFKSKKIISSEQSSNKSIIKQFYKSTKAAYSRAATGNDVLLSPMKYTSFDFYQDWDDEKKDFHMSLLTLEKAYSFAPLGKIKDSKTIEHIIGIQSMLYTPYISTREELQYMAFPRLLAFAECAWTKKEFKNFADFEKRLKSLKNYFFIEKELPPIDLVRINANKSKNKK